MQSSHELSPQRSVPGLLRAASPRHSARKVDRAELVLRLQSGVGNQAVTAYLARFRAGVIQRGYAGPKVDGAADTLRGMDDIVYREPPLNEADGRALLSRITRGDSTVLAGLKGAIKQYGELNMEAYADAPIAHEWGLGEAKDLSGECFLIVGDPTGVSWAPYEPYLQAIAHVHPMFKAKQLAGAGLKLTDFEASKGKTIAALHILPSASDIKYCVTRGLATHTVYTSYAYITQTSGGLHR